MERFQGHINSYSLDQEVDVRRSLELQGFAETQSFALKEEESLQDTVPFLQMLQTEDPNFLKLLSLQNLNLPWELESYPESYSPVQSETKGFTQNLISASSVEGLKQALSSQELPFSQANMTIPSSSSSQRTANSKHKRKISHLLPQELTREKRKRRKTKQSKNIEDVESQRMNHIAVERNRRRQMNEHINSLRALLPLSYIQRGDQASIVGGAIDYVKVLEQTIQSLESQKRTQRTQDNEHLLCIPKIEATVIQNHVNLQVQCQKKQGQLLKGIISLEKLQLTVLHLNIISLSHSSVSYCFNLKIEDDCDLESAEEITEAVHKIFNISDDMINI